jgi:hypothetical protein
MINAVNSARNVEATQLSPEVQQQQAAKTAQAKPQSVPQDSVTLKSTGDQDHDGDSK